MSYFPQISLYVSTLFPNTKSYVRAKYFLTSVLYWSKENCVRNYREKVIFPFWGVNLLLVSTVEENMSQEGVEAVCACILLHWTAGDDEPTPNKLKIRPVLGNARGYCLHAQLWTVPLAKTRKPRRPM